MPLNDMSESERRKYNAAVRIQSSFRGHVVRKAFKLYRLGGPVSELLYSPAAYGLDMSALNCIKPKARASAQVGLAITAAC